MERVLIIKLGAFGDVVQAEGAVHDIRLHHPAAEVSVLTTPPYRNIFERCPWIDRVLIDHRDPRWRIDLLLALRRRIGFDRFEMIYDLQNSARTSFYFRWLVRRANWSGVAPGCSHPADLPATAKKTVPSIERLARQLEAAGVAVEHTRRPDVTWFAEDVAPLLRRFAVEQPYVVLLAGASARHPEKIWPYYHALAQRLLAKGLAVVTVPGPGEFEYYREFPGTMLTTEEGGFLDFFYLAGVLKQACFVVGNDTGPSHLAAHLGVPGIALFGHHASARMTSIERERFHCLEVDDLAQLPVESVLAEIERRM